MIQRSRLAAGLVLFTYVATHLLNHALGIVSLGAAEAGRLWFTAFWRFPLATFVLYTSLIVHIGLALYAIYRRRHFRLPRWELLRIALGLSIPVLLMAHLFGTRVQYAVMGLDDTYARQMLLFTVVNPTRGAQQIALLCIAWAHGWIGIYFWLRAKPLPAFTLPALRVFGLLVPLCALFGFVQMGREVAPLAADPARFQAIMGTPSPVVAEQIADVRDATLGFYLGCVALTFAARPLRTLWQRRHGVVGVTYPNGQRVPIVPGTTVLEASRATGIPHASLCGGRGRCSTCRTRVGAGLGALPPPSADERRVLERIAAPPNVRLACQLRPTHDLDVYPLLPPRGGLPADLRHAAYTGGAEQELAVLFSDMRAFTRLAEQRLPYDVVFLLNQYTAAMGEAIERAGGLANQFVGDGIMALFGLDRGAPEGCRAALASALEMARALERLNATLRHDLQEPIAIGIGIHMGPVIVGEMGYGRARYLTAIGDVVNTASRLETLTKDFHCQLVVSEDVAAAAGVDLSSYPSDEVLVRGRTRPLRIHVIASALDLAGALAAAPDGTGTPETPVSGERSAPV
jgi:adenylate cyclase